MPLTEPINILVTLNENYIPQMNVMLYSLLTCHPARRFDVYLLHSSIHDQALTDTRRLLEGCGTLTPIRSCDNQLADAPTTARYPREMYYRIFAAQHLPTHLDRILYLDPDITVNGDLTTLYEQPLGDHLFAAASHVSGLLEAFNERRLDCEDDSLYINSGVLLMNLTQLRAEQQSACVYTFIEQHKHTLFLPDQDIISGLYGHRILPLNPYQYNMTEPLLHKALLTGSISMDWVRTHAKIIHYCGRNKPWKPHYIGRLGCFYKHAAQQLSEFLT